VIRRPNRISLRSFATPCLIAAIVLCGCGSSVVRLKDGSGALSAPGAPATVGHYSRADVPVSFTEPLLSVREGASVVVSSVKAIGDTGIEVLRTGLISLPVDYVGPFYAVADAPIPSAWTGYLVEGRQPLGAGHQNIGRVFIYVEVRLKPGYDRGRLTELQVRYKLQSHAYELDTRHQLLLCKKPPKIVAPCSAA
jgi:hypothetical protein